MPSSQSSERSSRHRPSSHADRASIARARGLARRVDPRLCRGRRLREIAWILCGMSGAACGIANDADSADRQRERREQIDRSRAALSAQRPEAAIEELESLEQSGAKDYEVQMLLGEALLAHAAADAMATAASCARAERCFDRAAAARPQDPRPWIGRARACELAHRDAEALEHAARAERLLASGGSTAAAQELATFHLQRARRLAAQGQSQPARDAAQLALRCQAFGLIREKPMPPEAMRTRNDALVMLGRSTEALERMAQEIPADGGDESWHAELARCGRACADPDALARTYQDLAKRAPSRAMHWHAGRFWLERAENARLANRSAEAEATYERAAEELARCRDFSTGDFDRIDAERARALAGAAWSAFERDRLEEAARLWLAALHASPKLAGVGDVLDRSVIEGLEQLTTRWAEEGREAQASELLIAALKLAEGLGSHHARWLERMAGWSRREGTLLQRNGEASRALALFERSRDALRRAAQLSADQDALSSLRLRVEAVAIALHQLAPLLSGPSRATCVDDAERELRTIVQQLEASAASAPERREVAADANQLLGQLYWEHRRDLQAARAAFAACLAADPERAHAPELRWYLQRLAEPPKETQR
ncbi:MAG: hypothetical protein JNM84_10430 [Planctomycetes bacterium]|nr:hypothetical protein [Planctomycetota bacterium]